MKLQKLLIILTLPFLINGCWDRTEMNDLGFVMGTAFDLTNDGKIMGSIQISIPPSGQGGILGGGVANKRSFFVISVVGKNPSELIEKMQERISRRLFFAHRSVIFISEKMAKRGIHDILDQFNREPRNRMRTFIMVVKGAEAREVLNIQYPFEQAPTEAIRELEVLKTNLGVTMRDFFINASSEGITPTIGVIQPVRATKGLTKNISKIFRVSGAAIMKDLKLKGFLNKSQTQSLLWAKNQLKYTRLSADLPKDNQNIGLILIDTKSTFTPNFSGNDIRFHIKLEGKGTIFDNNSKLDIGQTKNLAYVKTKLEKKAVKQFQDMLNQAQKHYKVDIIGLGEELAENHPKQWKKLKQNWDQRFAKANIKVDANITIISTGMTGPPLIYQEKEIKKK